MRKTVLACALTALAVGGTSATAASLITGKDIKNGTVSGADIQNGSLRAADIKSGSISQSRLAPGVRRALALASAQSGGQPGAVGPAGAKGDKGENGANGSNGSNGQNGAKGDRGEDGVTPTAGNWGIVNRNTIGSPDQVLRSGPVARGTDGTTLTGPPAGTGALNFAVRGAPTETTSPDTREKAAWGNEVDFFGNPLSGVNQLGFAVFQTGENNAKGNPNMPSIQLEVDRNGFANTAAPGFSTLTFVPPNSASNQWATIDADAQTDVTGGLGWFYSGSGNASCTQAEPCTFAQAKALYPNAQILSVMVSKGRDFSWAGAIDALRINADVYDFEEHGVRKIAAP